MALRDPAPIPTAFDLTRFLSSSITFMVHLREVSIYFDGRRLARLTKDPGSPVSVPIPRGLKTSSPFNTMHAKNISSTREQSFCPEFHRYTDVIDKALYIEAEVARCVYSSGTTKSQLIVQAARALKPAASAVSSGFFTSLFSSFTGPTQSTSQSRAETPKPAPLPEKEADPLELRKSSVVLHIYSAEVDVRLDKKMVAELQRSTKKNPPSRLRLDLIYVGISYLFHGPKLTVYLTDREIRVRCKQKRG